MLPNFKWSMTGYRWIYYELPEYPHPWSFASLSKRLQRKMVEIGFRDLGGIYCEIYIPENGLKLLKLN